MKRIGYLIAFAALTSGLAAFEVYALTRQRIQMIVDTAAYRGALTKARGGDLEQTVHRFLARHSLPGRDGMVTIESPPPDGRFRDMPQVVRVRVRTRWSSSVIPFAGRLAIPLEIRAAATTIPPEPGQSNLPGFRVE